ncbi:hypothetical protein [Aquisalimonas asiatica]|uniref:Uncharacterized protein n=1 Tax=Aquisalimonas asiatica TaxID=406100 RepID=A0A1H8S6H0_9GAMM|nr:hypothetical protein [Aquisalimonas asiatica]SEO74235.1 hypothetical protein SAMN04488052_102537 [Aquisalimonas asiatica]
MPKPTSHRFSDRKAWPDDALRTLLERIDAELERREAQGTDHNDPRELETLEERLLREARKFQKESNVLRG